MVQHERLNMTHRSTLVLNAGYQPIEKVSWQRAFILVFQEKARDIAWYDDIVKTPSEEYFVPAVIVLNKMVKQPKRRIIYSKRLVCERDNYLCQYCRRKLSPNKTTIDHVRPRSKGGKSTFENTVVSCEPCNKRKGNKLLSDIKMRLIKKPRTPYIHPLRGKIHKPEPEWKEFLVGIF